VNKQVKTFSTKTRSKLGKTELISKFTQLTLEMRCSKWSIGLKVVDLRMTLLKIHTPKRYKKNLSWNGERTKNTNKHNEQEHKRHKIYLEVLSHHQGALLPRWGIHKESGFFQPLSSLCRPQRSSSHTNLCSNERVIQTFLWSSTRFGDSQETPSRLGARSSKSNESTKNSM
jgi:hypothetical protein